MITPSGKIRTMVAQNIADPILTDGTSDINNSQLPPVQTEEQPMFNGKIEDVYTQPPKENSNDDLTSYLFDKYVNDFNYIPRILQPLKNDFVEEEIDSGGEKKVIITLPSKYWGEDKRIDHEQIKQMIEEIQSKFNLYHIKTKINGDEIKMELTSTDSMSEENRKQKRNETNTAKEVKGLYSLYGKPPPGDENKSNSDKKADTIYDLIKISKANLMPLLINILGANNGTV